MSAPFYLVGPTAVGKTELAICLAEQIGAEIVSADAFQVYEGLDRLTAKPTLDQRWTVPHHLVGSVPLSQRYSVAQYLREAADCLAQIAARGKRALVVGGSGLYVKALTHGLAELPEAQPGLRDELDKLSPGELLGYLRELDPVTAARIDLGNKRRLVRALEVCMVTGQPFSGFRTEWQTGSCKETPVGIFLFRERPELVERIDRRTDALLHEESLREVREVKFDSLSATSSRILGLAEIRALLARTMDAKTCHDRIATKTRQYAKRQTTWFKREASFAPLNLSGVTATGCSSALEKAVRGLRPDFWK